MDTMNGMETDDLEPSECLAEVKRSRGRRLGWRKRAEQVPLLRRRKKSSIMPIDIIAQFLCCIRCCLADIPAAVLLKARSIYRAKNMKERSRWVFEWIEGHTLNNKTSFLIGGKAVCLKAWSVCLGCPASTYYQIKTKFLAGVTHINGPGNVQGKLSMASNSAISWLISFSKSHGDKMPNTYKIHLPSCMQKRAVYSLYKEEMDQQDTISHTHFFRLWKRFVPNVIIPKRSRFTVCDTCHDIKSKLEKTTNKMERKELHQRREKHLRQQNAERSKYYKHIRKAKSQPDQYLSIILDGMDQEKTRLPHLPTTPKSLSNAWKVQFNLMGAIAHGIGIYGFFDPFQWSHGGNYTISILCSIFGMLDSLPEVLYLQLDNCPGANKNRFVIGFLALLVQAGIFKKIKLSFLMVGHTHEDIDQLFSRFSTNVRDKMIMTLDSLMQCFERCYRPTPTAIRTTSVWNWSETMDINSIRNHSRPHLFKFVKDDNGTAIYFKKWSTDQEWTKCEGYLLKCDTVKKCSRMPLIPPCCEKVDEKVTTDTFSICKFYDDEVSGQWWADFFQDLKEQEDREYNADDIISTLKAKALHEQINQQPAAQQEEKEDEIAPVIIGQAPKKKPTRNLQTNDMVLVDTVRYADEWPQVASVLKIEDTSLTVQWFKGAKTSQWTPASRRIPGKRGKTEAFTETISKSVIWYGGFSLTPGGLLPKHARDALDQYFDD